MECDFRWEKKRIYDIMVVFSLLFEGGLDV